MPTAGDDFVVLENEAAARQVADNRRAVKLLKEKAKAAEPMSLEDFALRTAEMTTAELNMIVKADVDGSLEAIRDSLEKLSTPKVKVKVIHSGVGAVNESDVQLAIASKAIIVGFNVRSEARAMADAENHGIDMRFYRVIYELLDQVKLAMAGLLKPLKKEISLGRAEVRDTFSVPKIGVVAGCYVVDGQIKRGAFTRLLRDAKVVHEGKISGLRRFKDDVREVQSGYECGISLENFNDVKLGDVLEVYEVQEVAQTLD
jgi:translation initiation factor IF-2